MSTEHCNLVIVTREGGAWLADVPEPEGAHTFARTLPALATWSAFGRFRLDVNTRLDLTAP